MLNISTPALRATSLSFAAIMAGVIGAALAPETAAELESLLWVLAVIPAFLLAYHRGWGGVATVLAAVMAALTLVQVGAAALGLEMRSTGPVLRLVLVAMGTTAGVGILAELLQRTRLQARRLELEDPLTRLPNERHAAIVLEREFAGAERGRPLALVVFRIDGLAAHLLRHGRAAADGLLMAFARVLRKETRRMNFAARQGDRFVVILSSSSVDGAQVFVGKVQAGFAQAAGIGRRFSATAGIASYSADMGSPEHLLRAADFALFRAEQKGPGSLYVHETEDAAEARDLKQQLRRLRESPA